MAKGFFGRFGDTLSAQDGEELWRRLSEVDTTLVKRKHGRRSPERERYCVVHYLRTLARSGLLEYPFEIGKRERPDFHVRAAGRIYGLEVTEAGDEEYQEALTELEKAPAGSILEGATVRKPGEPLRGSPQLGDEPERLWTRDLVACVGQKTAKLAGFDSFIEYQLLVYDNTRHATAWTVTELPGRLAVALAELPSSERSFSRLSVLRDRVLMFDVAGDGHLLPVPPSPSLPPLLPLTRLGVAEESLAAFCRDHHIRKLGFFGSVREERFGPKSDVDVLVEFEPGFRLGLLRLAGIELELMQLLNRKVDLRTVPDLSRYFREEVVREKTDLAYAHAAG